MNITPEQADKMLYEGHTVETPKVKEGKDGGNWQAQYQDSYWNQLPDAPYEDAVLYAAAPDMAETIAGMEWQWGVERDSGTAPGRRCLWFLTEGQARRIMSSPEYGLTKLHPRLVRRLVGPVEVVE